MNKGPLIAGILFLVLGVFVCHQAIQLSLGQASRPGPGFVAFGLGSILILLSVLYIIRIKRSQWEVKEPRVGQGRYRILLGVVLLCFFGGILGWLGYLISTFFLFMGWLTFIERKKWYVSLALSSLALIFVYYFNLIFSVQLPKGLIKGL